MNRASDVTSKMVMGGLRHAAASKTGGGNANTTVSSLSCTEVLGERGRRGGGGEEVR